MYTVKIEILGILSDMLNEISEGKKPDMEDTVSKLFSLTGGEAPLSSPSSDGLCAQDIKKQLDRLLNKVNAVTCPYRHGQKVTDRVLTELSNRQLEVEEALMMNSGSAPQED